MSPVFTWSPGFDVHINANCQINFVFYSPGLRQAVPRSGQLRARSPRSRAILLCHDRLMQSGFGRLSGFDVTYVSALGFNQFTQFGEGCPITNDLFRHRDAFIQVPGLSAQNGM